MRKRLQKKMAAWLLAIAVLAGGCAGGNVNSTEDVRTSSTAEVTAEESGEPTGEEPIESGSVTEGEEPTTEGDEPTESMTADEEPTQGGPALPYSIKVSRTENIVLIYGKDASGAYTVLVKTMVCSVGTGRRTPVGNFAISNQYRWRALFSNSYGQYASRITGHILFHSVPYSAQSPDALITETYDDLGRKASLGCVRLKTIDAKWIYDNCPPGTPVEIYDGDVPAGVEKPKALMVDLNSPYKGWDPTDPDPNNPWRQVPITIGGVMDLTVECGSELDLLAQVFALDIDGKSPLTVSVSGEIDVNVCGTYTVTYSAVGAIGTTASVQATVTVVPRTEPATEETTAETEETASTEENLPVGEDASTEANSATEEGTFAETDELTEESTSAETEELTEEQIYTEAGPATEGETTVGADAPAEAGTESETEEIASPEDESSEER